MSRLKLFLIFTLSSVSAFLLPLIHINELTILQDWSFFNSFGQVIRSCIYHYHTFPMHDPWANGGTDLLANPQTRIFSPFILYDLLFYPPLANLMALLTMAIIGSFSMYRLLTYLKADKTVAIVVSIIFIHGTWFGLHFTEGHIIFGSFMLLGLAYYFILRIAEPRFKIYYALLNAFFWLDGAIYPFIFINFLFLISLLFQVDQLRIKEVFQSLYKQWKTTLTALFLFISLAGVKLIPFLMLHHDREPILESVHLDLKTVLTVFFDPIQYLNKPFNNTGIVWRFHELGAYLGIVSFVIILIYLIKNSNRETLKYLLVALFFFWIASGWFEKINPWHLIQKIPILNNGHVQNRYFLLSWFMLLMVLAKAINYFKTKHKPLFINSLITILIIESLSVSFICYKKVFDQPHRTYSTKSYRTLINNNNISVTLNKASYPWGYKFLHYERYNTGSKFALDPSSVRGNIKSIDDEDYKGEIYLTKGAGKAELISYTPGNIILEYQLDTTAEIQLNTNFLLGWKTSGNANIIEKDGLLTIQPGNLIGQITLIYCPTYWPWILILYGFGWLVLILLILFKNRILYRIR